MKKILIIFFLSLTPLASAVTYYVSSSGDDAANGISESTPWRTINRINSAFAIIKPGDKILFRRGDTFYGQLKITKSGTSANPITFGAYGAGDKPKITGFTAISGWTYEGNGIYSKSIICESPPEMVIINGTQYGMGRWPNNIQWATIDSYIGIESITDAELNSSLTNWTGAELIIRARTLNINLRYPITNHISQTLFYSGGNPTYPASNNFGYFIQNDIKTLDSFGEWYFNNSTSIFYMFFGDKSPVSYKVQVSTVDNLATFNTYVRHITFDNISFQGANKTTLYCYLNNNITIQNCKIDFSGNYGILGNRAVNLSVKNNIIDHSNDCAIWTRSVCNNTYIGYNEIFNTGLIIGSGESQWRTGKALLIQQGDSSIIEYNKVIKTAFSGITFDGDGTIVRNNFVDTFCYLKEDGAGIQYGAQNNGENMLVENNIVINAIGAADGKPSGYPAMAAGIYIDYNTTEGVKIINNTIANCAWVGIHIHSSNNIEIINNTIFNCENNLRLQETSGLLSIRGITSKNNVFFTKEALQLTMKLNSSVNDFDQFGTFDYNYYARPIDDKNTIDILINWGVIGRKTLEYWQTNYGHDLNSKKSPITLTDTADIDFYYNETITDKVIILNEPMIDVRGIKYVNSVSLSPFTSIILMVDPNPATPVVPVYKSSEIQNMTPSTLEMTYHVKLANSVPPTSAFTVTVNGSNVNVTNVNISDYTVTLTLASPVAYGDVVTVSYTKPATVPFIQSLTGGAAVTITGQPVTNNLLDPNAPNDPPVLLIDSETSYYSGFVSLIDASGSYDPNGDTLNFEWIVPADIPVSSTDSSRIRFLAPVLAQPQILDFTLHVHDGKVIQSQNIQASVLPYKPGLPMSKTTIIEASEYNAPDYPANIADGNLNTKWSINGDNQWLLFTLAQPFKVSHIQLGLIPDQKYESYFDIYASKDNANWDPALIKAASCNFSGNLQVFDFPADKTLTDYSYIKLVGHGSALNTWNHYSELKVFGNIGGTRDNTGNISIFPNPARDQFSVLILEPSAEPLLLKIFNATGSLCLEYQLNAGIYNAQIPINLCAGIYVAQVLLGSLIMYAQTLLVVE